MNESHFFGSYENLRKMYLITLRLKGMHSELVPKVDAT